MRITRMAAPAAVTGPAMAGCSGGSGVDDAPYMQKTALDLKTGGGAGNVAD